MDQPRGRNGKWLLGLILLAIIYSSWLYSQGTLTGTSRLDGSVGVILGLYICSHPAANAVDAFLFRRAARHVASSWRADMVWLALNMTVLLSGWAVIVIGAIRFTTRAL